MSNLIDHDKTKIRHMAKGDVCHIEMTDLRAVRRFVSLTFPNAYKAGEFTLSQRKDSFTTTVRIVWKGRDRSKNEKKVANGRKAFGKAIETALETKKAPQQVMETYQDAQIIRDIDQRAMSDRQNGTFDPFKRR